MVVGGGSFSSSARRQGSGHLESDLGSRQGHFTGGWRRLLPTCSDETLGPPATPALRQLTPVASVSTSTTCHARHAQVAGYGPHFESWSAIIHRRQRGRSRSSEQRPIPRIPQWLFPRISERMRCWQETTLPGWQGPCYTTTRTSSKSHSSRGRSPTVIPTMPTWYRVVQLSSLNGVVDPFGREPQSRILLLLREAPRTLE